MLSYSILLTEMDSGRSVGAVVHNITSFNASSSRGTVVWLVGGKDLWVRETVEDIDRMITEANLDMIRAGCTD